MSKPILASPSLLHPVLHPHHQSSLLSPRIHTGPITGGTLVHIHCQGFLQALENRVLEMSGGAMVNGSSSSNTGLLIPFCRFGSLETMANAIEEDQVKQASKMIMITMNVSLMPPPTSCIHTRRSHV